ncbi:NPCBM/NEW2 domain-containing protein [Cohnella terricola]|nr:NPCBM/NEW2 domain-containing protein [Cohnella terricola]
MEKIISEITATYCYYSLLIFIDVHEVLLKGVAQLIDKWKGFVWGIALSSIVFGSTAYASAGNSVEGLLHNARLMVDGVETASSRMESFAHKGKLYVPLALVSDVTGKRVQWDAEHNTVWIGTKAGRFDDLASLRYARVNGAARNHTITSRTSLKIGGAEYRNNGIKVELLKKEHTEGPLAGSLEYNLNGLYSRFSGFIGIDDLTRNSLASGSFTIIADGKERLTVSGLRGGDLARQIDIDVVNVRKLELVFTSDGTETVSIDLVHGKLFD